MDQEEQKEGERVGEKAARGAGEPGQGLSGRGLYGEYVVKLVSRP